MRYSKAIIKAIIIMMAIMLFPSDALADRATVQIGATILKYFKSQILQNTSSVIITEEDLARGYKEISQALVFKVRTNSRDKQYNMLFENISDMFRIEIKEGNRVVPLTAYGMIMRMFYGGGKEGEIKAFDYRIYLTPKTLIGEYDIPLRVVIMPD